MKKKYVIFGFFAMLFTLSLASCGEDIPNLNEDMIEVEGISDEVIAGDSKKISFTVGSGVSEFKTSNIKASDGYEVTVLDKDGSPISDVLKLKEGLNSFKVQFKIKDTIDEWTLEITREKAPVLLTSIEISEMQESYFVGDEFVPGKLKLSYSDNTSKVIDLTLAMVSGFDTTTPGSKTLTITYEGKTTTKEITVLKANSIGVKELKSEYFVGDEFVPGKLNVCKDGVESVIDLTLAMVTGFTTEEAGEVTLTIKYNDLTITHKITVKEHVYSLVVKEMELDYYVGEDFKGGKLTYTVDGVESEVELTLAMVSGFSTDTAGDKEITITYKDLTLKKTIKVSEHTYEIVKVNFDDAYNIDDPFVNGTIIVKKDGVELDPIALTEDMVEGFDTSTVGDKTLTIKYLTASKEFTIKVVDHIYEIVEVELDNSYFVNDKFVNGTIKVKEDGALLDPITLTIDMVEGFDTTVAGDKTLTIKYLTAEKEFAIKVIEHSYTLEVVELELNYYIDDEFKGGKLKYTADGVSEDVELTLAMVKGFDSSKAGDNEITITYKNAELKVTLAITNHVYEITEVVLNDSYYVGDEFVNGSIKVKEDGVELKPITLTIDMVEGFDTKTTGEKTLTIKYLTASKEFKITVKEHVYELKSLDIKKSFKVGDAFSEGTMVILKDGVEQAPITVTEAMVPNFTTKYAGSISFDIIYNSFKTTYTVEISHTYEIYKINIPDTFYIGHELSFYDPYLTIKCDGKIIDQRIELIPSMIEGLDLTTITENATMTVSYCGASKTAFYSVSEEEFEFEDFEYYWKIYEVGEQVESIRIKVRSIPFGYYKSITVLPENIENYNTETVGKRIALISYNGSKFDFAYYVVDLSVETPIISLEMKKNYLLNETVTAEIRLIYDVDNTPFEKIVMPDSITADTSTLGPKEAVITYNGQSYTRQIFVYDSISSEIGRVIAPKIYVGDKVYKLEYTIIAGGIESRINLEIFDENIIDTSKPGKVKYTFEIAGLSKEIELEVLPNTEEIRIEGIKDEYYIGEGIGSYYISYYKNGNIVENIVGTGLNISGFSTATPGKRTITVSYAGLEKTLEINVKPTESGTLEAILDIDTPKSYYINEELKPGYIIYRNALGEITRVNILEAMLDGFDTTTAGTKMVTLTYNELSIGFEIEVLENTRTLKVKYTDREFRPGETIVLTGVIYENGRFVEEVLITNENLVGLDLTKSYIGEVLVKYGDLEAKTFIRIKAPKNELKKLGNVKSEYIVGEDFSPFTIEHINGERIPVLEMTDFTSKAPGHYTITDYAFSIEFSYSYTVYAKGVNVEANNALEYNLNEAFRPFTVRILDSSYALKDVLVTEDMLVSDSFSTEAVKQDVFKFIIDGTEYTQNYEVNESSYYIEFNNDYLVGDSIDLKVYDASGNLIDNNDLTISGFDSEASGEFMVNVAYNNMEIFEDFCRVHTIEVDFSSSERIFSKHDPATITVVINYDDHSDTFKINLADQISPEILNYPGKHECYLDLSNFIKIEIFKDRFTKVRFDFTVVANTEKKDEIYFDIIYLLNESFKDGYIEVMDQNDSTLVRITEDMATGFDTSTVGHKLLSVKVNDYNLDYEILVYDAAGEGFDEEIVRVYLASMKGFKHSAETMWNYYTDYFNTYYENLTALEVSKEYNRLKKYNITNKDLVLISNLMAGEALYLGSEFEHDIDLDIALRTLSKIATKNYITIAEQGLNKLFTNLSTEKIATLFSGEVKYEKNKYRLIYINNELVNKSLSYIYELLGIDNSSFMDNSYNFELNYEDMLKIIEFIKEAALEMASYSTEEIFLFLRGLKGLLNASLYEGRGFYDYIGKLIYKVLNFESYNGFKEALINIESKKNRLELADNVYLLKNKFYLLESYGPQLANVLMDLTSEEAAELHSLFEKNLLELKENNLVVTKLGEKLLPVLKAIRSDSNVDINLMEHWDQEMIGGLDGLIYYLSCCYDINTRVVASNEELSVYNSNSFVNAKYTPVVKKDTTATELMRILSNAYELYIITNDAMKVKMGFDLVFDVNDFVGQASKPGINRIIKRFENYRFILEYYVYESLDELEPVQSDLGMSCLLGEALFYVKDGVLENKGIDDYVDLIRTREFFAHVKNTNLYLKINIKDFKNEITHSLPAMKDRGVGTISLNTDFGSYSFLINYHTIDEYRVTDFEIIGNENMIQGENRDIRINVDYGYAIETTTLADAKIDLNKFGSYDGLFFIKSLNTNVSYPIEVISREYAYGYNTLDSVFGDICYDKYNETVETLRFTFKTGFGKSLVIDYKDLSSFLIKNNIYPGVANISYRVDIVNKDTNTFKLVIAPEGMDPREYVFVGSIIEAEVLLKPRFVPYDNNTVIKVDNELFNSLETADLNKVIDYMAIRRLVFSEQELVIYDINKYALDNGIKVELRRTENNSYELWIGDYLVQTYTIEGNANIELEAKNEIIILKNVESEDFIYRSFNLIINNIVIPDGYLTKLQALGLSLNIKTNGKGTEVTTDISGKTQSFTCTAAKISNIQREAGSKYDTHIPYYGEMNRSIISNLFKNGELSFSVVREGGNISLADLTNLKLLEVDGADYFFTANYNSEVIYFKISTELVNPMQVSFAALDDANSKKIENPNLVSVDNIASLVKIHYGYGREIYNANNLLKDNFKFEGYSINHLLYVNVYNNATPVLYMSINTNIPVDGATTNIKVEGNFTLVEQKYLLYSEAENVDAIVNSITSLTFTRNSIKESYDNAGVRELMANRSLVFYQHNGIYEMVVLGVKLSPVKGFMITNDQDYPLLAKIIKDEIQAGFTGEMTLEEIARAIASIEYLGLDYKTHYLTDKADIINYLAKKKIEIKDNPSYVELNITDNRFRVPKALERHEFRLDLNAFKSKYSRYNITSESIFKLEGSYMQSSHDRYNEYSIGVVSGNELIFNIYNDCNRYTLSLYMNDRHYSKDRYELFGMVDSFNELSTIADNMTYSYGSISARNNSIASFKELSNAEIMDLLRKNLLSIEWSSLSSIEYKEILESVKVLKSTRSGNKVTVELSMFDDRNTTTVSYEVIDSTQYAKVHAGRNIELQNRVNPSVADIRNNLVLEYNYKDVVGDYTAFYNSRPISNVLIKKGEEFRVYFDLGGVQNYISMIDPANVGDYDAQIELVNNSYLMTKPLTDEEKMQIVMDNIKYIKTAINRSSKYYTKDDLDIINKFNVHVEKVTDKLFKLVYIGYNGVVKEKQFLFLQNSFDTMSVSIDFEQKTELETKEKFVDAIRSITFTTIAGSYTLESGFASRITDYKYDLMGVSNVTINLTIDGLRYTNNWY